MRRYLARLGRLEQATLLRHVALVLAAVTAYLMYRRSESGWQILWIIAGVAALNLLTFLAAGTASAGLHRIATPVSAAVGLASWAGLVHATGGADASPFVAGLWLEIVLSAMTFALRGIAAVTALSLCFLWLASARDPHGHLIAQSLLLASTGVATSLMYVRWRKREQVFLKRAAEQLHELERVQSELEQKRHESSISDVRAQLGHGLKNATHSLRGFAQMLEPGIASSPESLVALGGLRRSIDRLENLARNTLRSSELPPANPVALNAHTCELAIEDIVHDVAQRHPAIHCNTRFDTSNGSIPITREELDDVVGNLVINAVESMRGRGELTVETRASGEHVEILVSDNGAGIAPEIRERIFRPGFSSKAGGNGLGLYLVRRLVEKHGGQVAALPSTGDGACVRVVFPNLH